MSILTRQGTSKKLQIHSGSQILAQVEAANILRSLRKVIKTSGTRDDGDDEPDARMREKQL